MERAAEERPLWERLGDRRVRQETAVSEAVVVRRLKKWSEALNTSDEQHLEDRCVRAGVSYSDVVRELAAFPKGEQVSVPDALSFTERRGAQPLQGIESIAFGDILAPLADRALHELKRSLSTQHREILSPQAYSCLQVNLLENLSFISHHAILNELSIVRALYRNTARNDRAPSGEPPRVMYQALKRSFAADRGARFYSLYPVVQRLFALKIRQWKRSCRSIIKHLDQDREIISQELNLNDLRVVDHIVIGLSDPHHGGRSVAILRFSSGERVVYKPRPLRLEMCFARIADYVNGLLQSNELRSFRMADCGDHGWCEYVENQPLTEPHDIQRFFYRSGVLLAVLHAMRATDCHFENLACWNGFPVFLDLETLCHQDNNLLFQSSDIKGPGAPLFHSVTRVGLLPGIRHDADALELSPLAAEAIEPQHMSRLYEHVGTDLMRLAESSSSRAIPPLFSLQQAEEQDLLVAELQRGFAEGYTAIAHNKDTLVQRPEFLPSISGSESRFIARNTQLYGWLTQKCLEYNLLQSGIDRSLELEKLFRGAVCGTRQKAWFKVAEAERRALEVLDIPHFTTRLSDRHLRAHGRIVATNIFERTPLELATERIRNMCQDDLNAQLTIIEMLFAQKAAKPDPKPVKPLARPSEYSVVVKACDAIAEQIWRHRIPCADGSPSWLTLHPLLKPGRFGVVPGGAGLYQGSAGIGLFYAAHFAVTGNDNSKERSLAAFANALDKHTLQALVDSKQCSIGDGIAGIAYALSKGAELLQRPELNDQALELLALIDERAILESDAMCVVSGLAGLLLAMDVVCTQAPSKALRQKMQLVSERLIQREHALSAHTSTWITPAGETIAGFAHGSIGIAYAMMRAAEHLGDASLRRAARRGVQHAIDSYDPNLANWMDGRSQMQGETAACSWCHGAIGIGLGVALTQGQALSNSSLTHSRILQVLTQDLSKGPLTQSMCCGTAGALELLGTASASPESTQLANRIVHSLCDTDSQYCLAGNSAKVFMPGLFNGSGGVAYQLLKFVAPESVPGVLAFA